ncbi:MAG: CDP-diacylglycerol--glycerol-3-phosphate 3-phosphatidyltransferase [Christensenellaceae bacterium]|jgi:CDP-diacylglycerol--glycerol-3-phosphate 3-phosphatidyltransferase|nr:CDP-diacylglycerol--glycerol-3-phosphate 3-phosphatidyltransferase [Christensenellaceae bacterium]
MNKNVPNIITITRIILLPFIFFFYMADFVPYGKLIAVAIFIVAAVTDFLDGKIARKYNLVSNLGKLLDPIADKMLCYTGMILIAVLGVFPAWAVVVFLFVSLIRDFAVDCMRMLAAKQTVVLAAGWSGKIKTTLYLISIPLSMAFNHLPFINTDAINILGIIAFFLLWLATILCAYSGTEYLIKNRFVFKENPK